MAPREGDSAAPGAGMASYSSRPTRMGRGASCGCVGRRDLPHKADPTHQPIDHAPARRQLIRTNDTDARPCHARQLRPALSESEVALVSPPEEHEEATAPADCVLG